MVIESLRTDEEDRIAALEHELAAAQQRIEAMERHGWVSVTDRVPEAIGDVYVWDGENVQTAWWSEPYGDDPGHWEDPQLGDRGGGEIKNVTHWYPYPEPPTP